MNQIKFYAGLQYQIAKTYIGTTGILSPVIVINRSGHILLQPNGKLILYPGFAWDGASVPVLDKFDTHELFRKLMRGSAEHDAFYKLMRQRLLPVSYRQQVDARLRAVCIEDGMDEAVAEAVYLAVEEFGERHVTEPDTEILTAP